MVDIHCHLLPNIDDGPISISDSIRLARALQEDGITKVVCTPHVFPGRFENRRSSIHSDFIRFVDNISEAGISLDLIWAGEIRLTPEVLDLLPMNELPFLGWVEGYKTMLLEMPDGQIPLGADRFIRRFVNAGVRPVLVHPERNRGVMDRPERLEMLIGEGCFVQVTAGSLVGQFGAKALATARVLLDRGWIDAIASDAHNVSGRRPRMGDAARWLSEHYGAALAHRLTLTGPAGLCNQNQEANDFSSDEL